MHTQQASPCCVCGWLLIWSPAFSVKGSQVDGTVENVCLDVIWVSQCPTELPMLNELD